MKTANTPAPQKLLDVMRDQIRVKHYSIRTEKQYVQHVAPNEDIHTVQSAAFIAPYVVAEAGNQRDQFNLLVI